MGFTAMVPFALYFFVLDGVPLPLRLMVLPGILLGARIGPWLNQRLGRCRVMIGFSVLLLIEFTITFTNVRGEATGFVDLRACYRARTLHILSP